MLGMASEAWPVGKRGAVSLSYDRSSPGSLDVILPGLGQNGLTATFYIEPADVMLDIRRWRDISAQGHEIGNGGLLAAAKPDGSLPHWLLEPISHCVDLAEECIAELFPEQGDHSMAYPRGTPRCADGLDYREVIVATGLVARSGIEGFNSPDSCDIYYLARTSGANLSAQDLINLTRTAQERNLWMILVFEEIGSGPGTTGVEAHYEYCSWLADLRDEIWVGSLISGARAIEAAERGKIRLS